MRKVETILLSIFFISVFFLPCLSGCASESVPPPAEEVKGVRLDAENGVAHLSWEERDGANYSVYRARSTFGAREKVADGLSEPRFDTDDPYAVYTVTAEGGEEIGSVSAFSENTLIVAPTDDMAKVQAYIDERTALSATTSGSGAPTIRRASSGRTSPTRMKREISSQITAIPSERGCSSRETTSAATLSWWNTWRVIRPTGGASGGSP